ncbi:phospholipase D-like domain-containing protein [Nocardioides rubriscoriae]|uniref:phospholipase D-like domain-containing protein n=1 Tax=Nocardioides rubriscoriae TaxID=642762 RepID=UPI00147864F5|nr:phospholipase D-like domain-containing protein [Nocardioides rubriscoriae]
MTAPLLTVLVATSLTVAPAFVGAADAGAPAVSAASVAGPATVARSGDGGRGKGRTASASRAPELTRGVKSTGGATATARNRARPYNPQPGVMFNDPYGGDEARYRIFRHIVASIDGVPRGEKIRIAAWNLRSKKIAAALVSAHRRGVSVRVIMDSLNATAGNPNSDADYVQRALREGNKKRTPEMRSWLRKCQGSCRFPLGIAHTKFYAFSKVGRKSKDVVIYGSNNATVLAATIQWNDVYTVKGWANFYDDWIGVFNQMARDEWVRPPLRQYSYGPKFSMTYYPYAGPQAEKQGDPTLRILNKIRCQGATDGTGTNGRTKIRIGQTGMFGDRGKLIARRLITMRKRGCDIKFVYAMFGGDVVKMMRNAGIGMTHLAYDANDDGVYDRYIHMKAMAISGVYGRDTSAEIVWNGSANWTQTALESDEEVGEIRRPAVARAYLRWIDRLYVSRPASWTTDTQGTAERRGVALTPAQVDARTLAIARARGVDPYAMIKAEG